MSELTTSGADAELITAADDAAVFGKTLTGQNWSRAL
jgi:hypothetical protein